jgi:hypothetical protein
MVVYYLCRRGWQFVMWEPPVTSGDVDVRMRCPSGNLTDIQVKAPDRPGTVQAGRIIDGERDQDVLKAIDKGIAQLSVSPGPQRILIISPQRTWPIDADVLSGHLVGQTTLHKDTVVLRAADRGVFAARGRNIGAVVDLGLHRGEPTRYRCTVLLNPWAEGGAAPSPHAFPGARVLALRDDQFVWTPEEPQHAMRSGTRYVPDGDGA